MTEDVRSGARTLDGAAPAVTALLAAFAVLVLFAPTLGFSFLAWDDFKLLHDNPNIRGFTAAHVRWMFTTFHMGPYQPLSWLTYTLDYSLWGWNAAGFHLANNLLHAANAALFFLLSLALMDRVRPQDRELPRLGGALFAALLFALHPLRVESVAWITERRDVFSGFFYLLSLLFYVKAAAPRRGHFFLAASVLAYALCLLAKAAAFTVPLVLVLLDVYPLKRLPARPLEWSERRYRSLWLEKLPFCVLAFAAAVLAYLGQVAAGTLIPMKLFGPLNRAIQTFWGLGFYPLKTALPFGLSPLYETGPDLALYLPGAATAAAALACIGGICWTFRRSFPAGLAVFAYYLITILPVSGLLSFGVQLAADRYSYLSCMGLALLGGAALRTAVASRRDALAKAAWTGAFAVVLSLSLLTWRQLPVWSDTVSLWTRVISLDPNSLVARNNLGEEYARQARIKEAEGQFRAALLLNPQLPMTLNNLGNALADQGKREEALGYFQAALRSEPDHLPSLVNLCRLLGDMGRADEASAACKRALQLKPGFEPAEALLRSFNQAKSS